MTSRTSESMHIIWSMLFVAGSLAVSYMMSYDQYSFLLGLGNVDAVVAESDSLEDSSESISVFNAENVLAITDTAFDEIQEKEEEVTSLSDALGENETITALSDTLVDTQTIGQGTYQEVKDPVNPISVGNKQFFSVQQLFADGANDIYQPIKQGVLSLQDTYEWSNNGKFVLPQAVGVESEVQYILKDQRNTHYVYLGDMIPLVFDKVTQQGGTVVAIEDDLSINRSGFFGDRVWVVTLPAYEARNKIILLVQFQVEEDTWLLQIDRDRFELEGRDHLHDSFAEYYTW